MAYLRMQTQLPSTERLIDSPVWSGRDIMIAPAHAALTSLPPTLEDRAHPPSKAILRLVHRLYGFYQPIHRRWNGRVRLRNLSPRHERRARLVAEHHRHRFEHHVDHLGTVRAGSWSSR